MIRLVPGRAAGTVAYWLSVAVPAVRPGVKRARIAPAMIRRTCPSRWSADRHPDRDHVAEHRGLEAAALARDADTAAEALIQQLTLTATGLT
ncbi:hypothetical protein [Alloactinosynnema sp. L-07]|uniref:hypothetical protein n=1 Tax=Alloactinosynnema sp. L-07 TaxID=1653480 RepID=UPI00350F1915